MKVGDKVQWTCQGVDQFKTPPRLTKISTLDTESGGGTFGFVEGNTVGLPIEQLSVVEDEVVEEVGSFSVLARIRRLIYLFFAAFWNADVCEELMAAVAFSSTAIFGLGFGITLCCHVSTIFSGFIFTALMASLAFVWRYREYMPTFMGLVDGFNSTDQIRERNCNISNGVAIETMQGFLLSLWFLGVFLSGICISLHFCGPAEAEISLPSKMVVSCPAEQEQDFNFESPVVDQESLVASQEGNSEAPTQN